METFANHTDAQGAAKKYYSEIFGQKASIHINECEDEVFECFEIFSADDPANEDTFKYNIADFS